MSGAHCLQYAYVGRTFVANTENLDDEEVRLRALQYGGIGALFRFDRCPACEAWTREGGALRRNMGCPAVEEELRLEISK